MFLFEAQALMTQWARALQQARSSLRGWGPGGGEGREHADRARLGLNYTVDDGRLRPKPWVRMPELRRRVWLAHEGRWGQTLGGASERPSGSTVSGGLPAWPGSLQIVDRPGWAGFTI